ncbi:monocarboxylate transporter 13 [Lingula anatina]|uniref:Monocarboxylate transporter 13 n=1 Tax=Lingula anatina TaxID=7574 RepID=A0A1S3K8R9_LINAN|nr:monocarboxylate transporter 13 [Lingula anatina]XP_013418640.1 monocarboxylate transporter 13 [Lingula anatina]XP_013418641.1 monocarboxylate transporter 13 [Lingula anatina]XP_013418642.1 monocarboxylate transporter 13 [Lingula anatina]XP_013418643.1 monocarboxylate transporter 13 [Lingula anatina]XP_013418644.1 monocarboxylate transporter 13 [Lingula anatina]XP_013418646.1 monocarboxylate transporter 13 [Lingula anatina]|eukprot:XP_013418639.1 monocarboxylate transporter 13 [Lingula anatina]
MKCGRLYWGWIILVASMVIRTWVHGIVGSYGSFLVVFSHHFSSTKMLLLGWIGATTYGLVNAGTPILLLLYRRIGGMRTAFIGVFVASLGLALSGVVDNPVAIFFTYGVMTGMGMLLINIPPFFLLDMYFPLDNKYHVLTTSMLMCTLPLGSLVFNPITSRLISDIGWKNTFAFYGVAIFVLGCISAATFRVKREDDIAPEDNEKTSLTDAEDGIIKPKEEPEISKKVLIFLSIIWFFCKLAKATAYFGPLFIMVKHLETLGYTRDQGAVAMTIISSSELFGRLVTCVFGDKYAKGKFIYLYAICTFLLAIENFGAIFATTYNQVVMFGVAAGLTGGPVVAGVFTTCAEVLDGPFVHELFTICRVGLGSGMILSALIAGAIYDTYGSYHYVFAANVGIFLLSSLLYSSIALFRNFFIRKQSNKLLEQAMHKMNYGGQDVSEPPLPGKEEEAKEDW